ncbi:hypothetical protein ACFPIF_10355 [Brevundimonas faecalis]|uniref:hypothetical protein n=1 Tax=Brevundimonas faecalis TaxID=947378 RepID=UPI00360AFEFA
MARKTIHCVQIYWRINGRLEGAAVEQFQTEAAAKAYGELKATAGSGVAVFTLRGEPAMDHWDEAEVLATYGDAPAM